VLFNLGEPRGLRHRCVVGSSSVCRRQIRGRVGASGDRRGRTRYEKLAIHYLARVQISMIRLMIRRLELPPSQSLALGASRTFARRTGFSDGIHQ
jgi:hypothetical protein